MGLFCLSFSPPPLGGERSVTEGTPTEGRISKHDVCGSDRVEPNGVSQDGERERGRGRSGEGSGMRPIT